MDQEKITQNSALHLEDGRWKMRWRKDAIEESGLAKGNWLEPASIKHAAGPRELTEREAKLTSLAEQSTMTIAEFVERKFVPEHVAHKELSGRAHYRSMLKHVLTPEEVDRVFRANSESPRQKLRKIPDWPYLSNVRLCDAAPDHVHRLISAAKQCGYSAQTVTHIRNVVSSIFTHAKQERCFVGDNPTNQVRLSESTRREGLALTLDQAKAALGAMKYPEKEMMLMATFTDMNISEICGLRWRHVNMTETTVELEGERIPPRTIAVRTQWYRGEMGAVKKSRVRNLPIPLPLLQTLIRLSQRPRFTQPDDFVLASRAGTAVNQTNIVARKLRPIARRLGIVSLSWLVLFRTRKALAAALGKQFQDSMAMMVRSASLQETGDHLNWRCRRFMKQPS